MIPASDIKFLHEVILPALRIRKQVNIVWSDSARIYPDVWTDSKTIWVTREWLHHNYHERRKRLLHECLHLRGLSHGVRGGYMFSTDPTTDTFSMHMYNQIIGKQVYRGV